MLLTVEQAAARAAVSPRLLYELCARGLLPHVRLGRPGQCGWLCIDSDELNGFLAAFRREGPADDRPLNRLR